MWKMKYSLSTILLLVGLYRGCAYAQQFTVRPESVVQAEGLEAVFECLNTGAVLHAWGLNGEFPPEDQFPFDLIRLPPSGDTPARLIIPATPQYNNTVVQCRAVTLLDGNKLGSVFSDNATLEVQGALVAVGDLSVQADLLSTTSLTISWDPPFSLNLTTAEPAIQYCVDVYNVTGGGDDHLQSVCDITDTYYTFTASDPDQLFNFTVTPRSNVEGSLNGTTSQPVQGSVLGEPVVVDTGVVKVNLSVNSIQVMIPRNLLGPPGRVPTHYTIEPECEQENQVSFNCTSQAPRMSGSMVNLSINCDFMHQICNVTIFAMNDAGSTKYTPSLTISTYHVQSAQANYSKSGNRIDITCSYLDGSTDPGCFVIAFFLNGSLPMYYVGYRNGLESNTDILLSNVPSRNVEVVVYDLQIGSGFPEYRSSVIVSPESSENERVLPERDTIPSNVESTSVTTDTGKICLSCSFPTDKLTGCVGVIHSARLMDNRTLTVLTVERNEGVNCAIAREGSYTVAVFGWTGTALEKKPTKVTMVTVPLVKPDVWIIIAGVLALAFVLCLVIVMIVVLYLKFRKSSKGGLLSFCGLPSDYAILVSGSSATTALDGIIWKDVQEVTVYFQNPDVLAGWGLTADNILEWTRTWNDDSSRIPVFKAETDVEKADIRVKFSETERSWSMIGMHACKVESPKPTMQLNLSKKYCADKKAMRSLVAHEFGHALGLKHEHHRSNFWAVLEKHFDIYRMKNDDPCMTIELTAEVGVSSSQHASEDGQCKKEYDPDSVMHYWFDLKWLENSDFRDIRRVNKSTDLSEEEKICLRGLHKRLTGLPENPSGTDLKMLREAYGLPFQQ